jgi:hypothetical protein
LKKNHRIRPGLREREWGMTELSVIDLFNNHITFGALIAASATWPHHPMP